MSAFRMLAAAGLVLLGASFLCLMAVFFMPGGTWRDAAGDGPWSYAAWIVMAAVVLFAGLLSALAVWMIAMPVPSTPPNANGNANGR